jgi:hypothetical protein
MDPLRIADHSEVTGAALLTAHRRISERSTGNDRSEVDAIAFEKAMPRTSE